MDEEIYLRYSTFFNFTFDNQKPNLKKTLSRVWILIIGDKIGKSAVFEKQHRPEGLPKSDDVFLQY